jgi:hypothetical protein
MKRRVVYPTLQFIRSGAEQRCAGFKRLPHTTKHPVYAPRGYPAYCWCCLERWRAAFAEAYPRRVEAG